MANTAARTLALVALLQRGSEWTGAELAEQLGVSERTIRNDVERIRSLGYQVDSTRGPGGRYRLGAGGKVPPLVLTEDEAVAVSVALRAAPVVPADADPRDRVLTRLQQSLPEGLRDRVFEHLAEVAPELALLSHPQPAALGSFDGYAAAIRENREVRFDYNAVRYRIEPHRLVHWRHRWYLVGRRCDDRNWACFRLDLIEPRGSGEHRFTPDLPADSDFASLVLADDAPSDWAVRARIAVDAGVEQVLARVDATASVVEYVTEDRCVIVTGAQDFEVLALRVAALGVDVTVLQPPQLRSALAELAKRCRRAADR